VSRRALLVALVTLPLAACGKRGAPLPPPDQVSDFPRVYPAPANYPHPEIGNAGKTQQNSPPEQQRPTPQDASGGDMSAPGLYP
jgi:hypothetical protein